MASALVQALSEDLRHLVALLLQSGQSKDAKATATTTKMLYMPIALIELILLSWISHTLPKVYPTPLLLPLCSN
jgi:hypothetical protein